MASPISPHSQTRGNNATGTAIFAFLSSAIVGHGHIPVSFIMARLIRVSVGAVSQLHCLKMLSSKESFNSIGRSRKIMDLHLEGSPPGHRILNPEMM